MSTTSQPSAHPPIVALNPGQGSVQWRDLQRARLAQTKQKIRDFQADLERLDAQRQELETVLETFLFPVLTIPPELMSKIFVACLPANGRVQPSRRAAPLLLAQICRQSVDLTFQNGSSFGGDPWIRSTGTFSMESGWQNTDSPYDGACKLLQTWFRRTSRSTLSITLRCDSDRVALPPSILPAIAEFSKQWGRLEILLPVQDLPSLDGIRGPFPLLHSLTIKLTKSSGLFPTIKRLSAYRDAPRLHEIRLPWGLGLKDMSLGSISLTTLELHRAISIKEWIAIFKRFRDLTHFAAALDQQLPPNSSGLGIPPPLESLIIGRGDPISVLTLPYLRRLSLSCWSHREITTFIAFVSRSSCALQHLTLRAGSLDCALLLDCLRAVPSLVILEITRTRSDPALYAHLHSPEILPHLRELSFGPIIAMLRARREPHPVRTRLRSFDLTLDVSNNDSDDETSAPSGTTALQLQRMIDDGLRFRVHTPSHNWPDGSKDDEVHFE
ncbi:hypothetical protein B0H11DRAFT_2039487 [Mycena galericulata]|nr:hypothetical protein B0H11DRAFT_2039487 [Mycena galericulata]